MGESRAVSEPLALGGRVLAREEGVANSALCGNCGKCSKVYLKTNFRSAIHDAFCAILGFCHGSNEWHSSGRDWETAPESDLRTITGSTPESFYAFIIFYLTKSTQVL